MERSKSLLLKSVLLIVGGYFSVISLIEAKGFLAPLVTAVILALLMIPFSKKLESWKFPKLLASFSSTIVLLIFSLGILSVLSFQVKSFVDDWDNIKENMEPRLESLEQFVIEKTWVDYEELETYKDENDVSSLLVKTDSGEKAFEVVNSFLRFLTDALLVIIYVFFLIHYRSRFKTFLLKLFSKEQQSDAKEILSKTTQVAQDYLRGKLILIVFLSVLYSIGLGVSGVSNFILVSIIAAVLTLIPFIGNILGMLLAIAFGFVLNGDFSVLIGIVITFSIVQFIESYIFEPYVVGEKVDLHPFFVILVIILANMVWGVIGMILAIPVFGILNVVFQYIEPLKPFGYLFGNSKNETS